MQNRELPTAEDDDWRKIELTIGDLGRAVKRSTLAQQIVDGDERFLAYLRKNNVTPEARKAMLLLLSQDMQSVELAFEKWRAELEANKRREKRGGGEASGSRERLQLIPTTYKLLKAAEFANPELEWSIKLPRYIFKLALEDFVSAARGQSNSHTANKTSVSIMASRIYTRWETFDASQQVKLIDLTVGKTAQIDQEWNSKQGTNKRKYIQQYYPELQDYERALENVPAYEYMPQSAAVEDPHFHNFETAASTDYRFHAQQRDSTHATVFRPDFFNDANDTFAPSQSYGGPHHSIPIQQSHQYNFASSPGVPQQQQFHHHSLRTPTPGLHSSFAATLPPRPFVTQGLLPHHHPVPSYSSPAPLFGHSTHETPSQPTFDQTFVEQGRNEYIATYPASEQLPNSYSVQTHPSSTYRQPDNHSTQNFSYLPPSYPPYSQPPDSSFYSDPAQRS